MKHALSGFIGIIIGVTVTVLIIFLFKIVPNSIQQYQMSYSDLSAILLTAVSVMVTILGIVVAILAFWGYGTILKAAQQSAKDHVESKLESGGDLRTDIEDIVLNETRPFLRSISSIYENVDEKEKRRELGDETSEYGDE